MKPTLVIQDFGGAHNMDLAKSRARLIKGASWKKTRIVCVIPAGESIPAVVALSHWNLIFPPNQPVVRILAQGMEVGEAYSTAIEQVLAHPELKSWEYVLSVEHDNLVPQDGVLRLIERMEQHPEFDCIGGLYFTKGEGGVAQIWGDPHDPVLNYRPQPPDTRMPDPNDPKTKDYGLVECCGTGMGFNLWRMRLFKDAKIERPLFKTLAGPGGVGTQDLAFWSKARKFGYRCAVDCGCKVGHWDSVNSIAW